MAKLEHFLQLSPYHERVCGGSQESGTERVMQIVAHDRTGDAVPDGGFEFVTMVPIHQRRTAVLVAEGAVHLESGDLCEVLHAESNDRNAE